MIIDFHIHIHPFPTGTNGLRMPEDYRQENAERLARIGISADQQAAKAVERMDLAGVDAAVVQNPYHGRESGHIRSNQTVYEAIKPFAGRLYAFAGIYITPTPDLAELEHAAGSLGFKGLKILPASQGFRVNDFALMDPLYRKLVELNLPLLVHAGPTNFPGSDPSVCDMAYYRDVVERHPDLKLIQAHLGSGAKGGKEAALKLAAEYPNFYIEASTWMLRLTREVMPPYSAIGRGLADPFLEALLFPKNGRSTQMQEAWERGKEAHSRLIRDLAAAAPGKLIYGTDLPFAARFDFVELYREALKDDPVNLELVLGGTARRLLNI